MLNEITQIIVSEMQREGYISQSDPKIPGLQALLYASSPHRFRLGFAKVEDHYLFIDWENAAFGRLDYLLEFYKRFSAYVNRRFPIPHALRMQIPNLAVIAVSQAEFPLETVRFVRTTYLNPWYGGESGQIILLNIKDRQVLTHVRPESRRNPLPGAFPLMHAEEIIREVCKRAFQSEASK
jgi:hypothetical protein